MPDYRSKKEILNLAKKKDKDIFDMEFICNQCAWAHGADECVVDGECKSPELTGFKPNWLWKLVETPTKINIKDVYGKTIEFEYTIFSLEKEE